MAIVSPPEHEGACWRCDERTGLSPACGSCQAPQPIGPETDHYAMLGLERSLVVDPAVLERRYHDLARSVHPDRHQMTDPRSTALSVQATAAINRAYRTLRDAVGRGRYWLELHGRALGRDNNVVPPALAVLVFEVQEQLEALRETPGSAGVRAGVETARAELRERLARETDALADCYVRWGTPTDDASLDELKRRLTEIAYLTTLVADVDEALEP